jgi:3-hydroxyisobutyrate dehydrogenase-like beta-hydroxyacid dehydrogenase
MITKLERDGDNYIGRAKIMTETPYGGIVKSLMDEGATLGVSSRGMGSLKQSKGGVAEVQNDFYLATAADIVADPSAPNAFVEGIMEGADWVFDAARNEWQMIEADKIRSEVKKMSAAEVEANKLQIFEQFLKTLSR